MKTIDQESLRDVVESVLRQLNNGSNGGGSASAAAAPKPESPKKNSGACSCNVKGGATARHGVFTCVNSAAEAAHDAFEQLRKAGVQGRAKVVEIVKSICVSKASEWGPIELEETGIGRADHKVAKLEIIKNVPGVEWLQPYAMSGDAGIMLEEYAPFGVIGAILPVTHSVPTLSGNVVNMVAAGNAIVFNPHPGGARCAALAVHTYNEAIKRELGISNLICTIEEPTLESFDAICQNDLIGLLNITGGPGVVKAAMKSGKRAICAGPGNPVVVVDATANLAKAARHIIQGAAFDNNLLCIGEKAVFVVDSVFDQFSAEMEKAGAVKLTRPQLKKLAEEAFTYQKGDGGCSKPAVNRKYVGADPDVLARAAGTSVPAGTELLFAEAPHLECPFVEEEQMMPMLPLMRVPDFETAVDCAKKTEHGYKHSSIIHSLDVNHMTYMARAMDTTIFVKNGPCVAGLGLGGEGYLSYSIATTTGEGITTPKTFTRIRRCIMVENLRII